MKRRSLLRQAMYPVEYGAIRAALSVIQTLPLSRALAAADAIGDLIQVRDRRHRQVAGANLAAAFPDLGEQERSEIVRGVFRHMARCAAEMAYVPRLIGPSTWSRHLEFIDLEPARERLDRGPAVLVTGHLGNWEVLGAALGLLGIRSYSVARRLDNPFLERYVHRVRELRGQRILHKRNAMPRLVQAVREGGNLVFLVDQDAGHRGVFVPFFGRPASVIPTPAVLARRLRLPVLPGYAIRVPGELQFHMIAGRPLDPEEFDHLPFAQAVQEITARFTAELEAMIRRAVDQWLWVHRRWKSQPPPPRDD